MHVKTRPKKTEIGLEKTGHKKDRFETIRDWSKKNTEPFRDWSRKIDEGSVRNQIRTANVHLYKDKRMLAFNEVVAQNILK